MRSRLRAHHAGPRAHADPRRSNGRAGRPLPTQFLNRARSRRGRVGSGSFWNRAIFRGRKDWPTPARPLRRRARPIRSGTALRPSTRPAGRPRAKRFARLARRPPYWIAATAAAHAPVPDASVGPTPRSQIRMRTRSGASTRRELDVRAGGKMGMHRQLRGNRVQPGAADLAEDHALGVADAQRHRLDRHAVNIDRRLRRPARGRPSRRGTYTGPLRTPSSSRRLMPASVSMSIGRDLPRIARRADDASHAPRQRTPLPDTSEWLPSALSSRIDAPVGVSSYTISPSAPMPRWRSQMATRQRGAILRGMDVLLGGRGGNRSRMRGP